MSHDAWSKTMAELDDASQKFVKGDPGPLMSLWSHEEDVTIFGAFGGLERGWSTVGPRLEWASSQFVEGAFASESLSAIVGDDLAYTAHIERAQARIGDRREPVLQELRVTQVFRRERGVWRVVHRHADSLVVQKPPR